MPSWLIDLSDIMLMRRRLELNSPLPVAEVQRTLMTLFRFDLTVHGRVRGDRFWFRRRRQLFSGSQFETYIVAKLTAEGKGTRVSGAIGLGAVMTIFVLAWFAVALAMLASVLGFVVAHPSAESLIGLAVPAALVGIMWVMAYSSRREDEPWLTDVLKKALRAA
ncbi:MAG: hypothetical protein KBA31_05535 [Alphaproteobacteria bacterium]|nr:hypothetical protein [Alphaproteobacteria bacterium]